MFSVIGFFLSGIGQKIAIAAGFIISVVTFGLLKKREGKKEYETDLMVENSELVRSANDAMAKEEREIEGLSAGDLIDRMRSRHSGSSRL